MYELLNWVALNAAWAGISQLRLFLLLTWAYNGDLDRYCDGIDQGGDEGKEGRRRNSWYLNKHTHTHYISEWKRLSLSVSAGVVAVVLWRDFMAAFTALLWMNGVCLGGPEREEAILLLRLPIKSWDYCQTWKGFLEGNRTAWKHGNSFAATYACKWNNSWENDQQALLRALSNLFFS